MSCISFENIPLFIILQMFLLANFRFFPDTVHVISESQFFLMLGLSSVSRRFQKHHLFRQCCLFEFDRYRAHVTVLKPFPPMRIFTTIDEILTEVAAGDDVRRYFEARGLRTVGTLALVAASEEMFTRHVCDPLLNGYTVGTDRITVAESEKPIARAVLLHAWSLAKVSWSRSMTPAPTPTPSAPTVTATTTTGSPNNETKVPKSLPLASGPSSSMPIRMSPSMAVHGIFL